METTSLKALARKVLYGNMHGNKMETRTVFDGNIMETSMETSMETKAETNTRKLPLSDFEAAGLVRKVWSEVLREHIYFISSDAVINQCSLLDAVAYTAKELQAMLDMTPEEVKAAHEVKKVFGRARIFSHKQGGGLNDSTKEK